MSEMGRKRPWLAVLLALVISGLGHAYLRRWGRALGWYVAITITLVFVVPDGAIDQLLAGSPPPVGDIFPALLVAVASVVDAYVLAVRHNRTVEKGKRSADVATAEHATADHDTAGEPPITSEPITECPHCGREVDAELDFCHWCTEELPERGQPNER